MVSPARLLPLIVASALFMENMDSTVIATSLPAIAADLGTDPIVLKLAFTTYLLSLTVFIPISGWCADRFGAKHVFRAAIAVFMLGSIACGYSQSLGWLIAARALQGLGGAMMVPVGRLIILREVPKSQLVDALAWLTIPALIGPLVGPPIGGFITTYFDWRWIFWMNVPIGLLGIVVATRFLPEMPPEPVPPLDFRGFLLSALGLSSLVFGFTIIGRDLLPIYGQVLLIIFGAVCLALYVRHAATAKNPILDLKLLRIPTFRAGVEGGSFYRIGVGAIPFLMPLMFQLGFGLTRLPVRPVELLGGGGGHCHEILGIGLAPPLWLQAIADRQRRGVVPVHGGLWPALGGHAFCPDLAVAAYRRLPALTAIHGAECADLLGH